VTTSTSTRERGGRATDPAHQRAGDARRLPAPLRVLPNGRTPPSRPCPVPVRAHLG
jgi:hypothetical protein